MKKETADKLLRGGIDLEDGTQRVAGNEGLFIRLLKKFPLDPSYERFNHGMEKGDLGEAFQGAHGLKSVSGNLSMIRLYPVSSRVSDGLKKGLAPEPADTEAMRQAYEEVVRTIQSLD